MNPTLPNGLPVNPKLFDRIVDGIVQPSEPDTRASKIAVLDKGWVELLDIMPHPMTGTSPELAIVNAARVSFLGESKGVEKDARLLLYLLNNRHTSPFEQVQFKFRIHAPVVTWWQLVRHRTLSLNLQSGRYTEFAEDAFYMPKPNEWRRQSASNKQGSSGFIDELVGHTLTSELETLINKSYALYKEAISWGVAREQARLFLPAWASYYTGVISVDAHNLMHFLSLRRAPEAQYEIRVYAEAIYEHFFKPHMPITAGWMESK
jgi:thymidylate synthase (FAD)